MDLFTIILFLLSYKLRGARSYYLIDVSASPIIGQTDSALS
jgi:hypothetical protein